MLPGVTILETILHGIVEDLRRLATPIAPDEAVPVASIVETTEFLHRRLVQAMESGSEEDQRAAACQVSGMRKGILELGVLDHQRHAAIIDAIDRVSDQALEICLS